MKYRLVLAVTAALTVAGCSDDGGSASPTTAPAAPTTEGVSTTAGSTTGVTAPATTEAVSEQVAQAERIAGTYTGTWENTTFGSIGTISAEFTVDAASATATMSLDIGGNAFGSNDPAPIVTEIDLTADGPIAGTNDFLGDFTLAIDGSGHLTLIAAAVPGVGGKTMTVEGDFADGAFTGTYTIAGLADGTFTATRA